MRKFSHLTRLTTLKVTFTSRWDVVVVEGMANLAALRDLSLRNAPTIVVREPMSAHRISLHATSALLCPYRLVAEHLSLECNTGIASFDIMITPETAAKLHSLRLVCPGRVTLPWLDHMHELEELEVHYNSVIVPLRYLAIMPKLRRLTLRTRYGIAVSGYSRLPESVVVKAEVGGVPQSDEVVQALFYGHAR